MPNYQLFCDLDGVISDFDSRFEHFTGKTPTEYDDELTQKYGKKIAMDKFWAEIDPIGTKFWSEMDLMPDAMTLWNYIEKYDPKFLSSPSRSQTSRDGKKEWCSKHFPGVELILKIASEKQEYSCETCILIDDKGSNIDQWNARGGIGILHTSANDTIKRLKELGL